METETGLLMTEHEANAATEGDDEIKRVPSHVPGLDTILCGGFLSGGVYLIQGSAGAGKTVLASQIIYSHAALGNRALFVTVLGENQKALRLAHHVAPGTHRHIDHGEWYLDMPLGSAS